MSIDISEEAGVRYLHFGSDWIQGAMRIARPFALELDYTREMMLPLLLRDADWPRRVLIVGLGAASVLKFLWRHRPQARFTVVEIDPRVVAAARAHFRLPDDPARIDIRIADGADFVIADRKRHDLILVDGFDADARAGRLDTLPFYLDCRSRLAADGILSVNLLSRRRDFRKSVDRLREAFDGNALAMPSCDSGNAIALAATAAGAVPPLPLSHPLSRAGREVPMASLSRSGRGIEGEGWPTFEALREAAEELRTATRLNLLPTLSRLSMFDGFPGGRFALAV